MHPLLPLLLLSILRAAAAASPAQALRCSGKACGDLNITYPFWLEEPDQPPCGSPSFQLYCNDSHAFMKRSVFGMYNVVRIFPENSSFVLVDHNLPLSTGCPVPHFNISYTVWLSPFNISKSNMEMFFLYNCTKHLQAETLGFHRLPCGNDSFVRLGQWEFLEKDPARWDIPPGCFFSVVPFLGSPDAAHYLALMNNGFLLEWTPTWDCAACSASGGQCTYGDASFACLCSDGLHSLTCDGRRHIKMILIVSVSGVTTLLLTCLVWMVQRRKQKIGLINLGKHNGNQSNTEEILKEYKSLAPKRYKYSELKKITRSFKDKLGEGGYGVVYKGTLQDSQMVAVKLLKGYKVNGEEFLNEVISIGRTSHVNIVSLIGFCLEGSKRALVYEYMANGSLEKYIYSEDTKLAIGWQMLQCIAIGIARGLEYLHRGCSTRIIHFDIKPHNILLDQDFCSKITDFGLAKLCHLKDSVLSMAEARGTIGFIAPEVFSRGFGVVSTKSDVYSYGMMLLEMVGGGKNVKENVKNSSEAYFPDWIYDHLEKELQSCEVTSGTEEIARKMTLVGLWCIQTNPGNRPSMSRVIEMLERNTNELEMPPKPFLSCPSQSLYVSSHSS